MCIGMAATAPLQCCWHIPTVAGAQMDCCYYTLGLLLLCVAVLLLHRAAAATASSCAAATAGQPHCSHPPALSILRITQVAVLQAHGCSIRYIPLQ